jgi:glyoxalase/bleomycin resistance protein/dioxygenase superfamily protein
MKTVDMKTVQDLKVFVPAENYAVSKQFYLDLGFSLVWEGDQLACLQVGEFRFLLQNFYVKELAGNLMMHLMVTDADPWWQHIQDIKLAAKYPDIMCRPPTLQPWGLRVLYLSDPSGVLWHIADRPAARKA